jgi:hypothetical protein
MNLQDVCKELEKKVNMERFSPVERIVYGMISVILFAFLGAVVALIIK